MLARDFTLLYSFSVLKLPSIEVRTFLGKKNPCCVCLFHVQKTLWCHFYIPDKVLMSDLNYTQNFDEKLTNNRNTAQKQNLLKKVQVYKSHFMQCQSDVSV